MYDDFKLKELIKKLTNGTKNSKVLWKKVPRVHYDSIIDRPIVDSQIKDSFYTDKNTSRIVVGKYQSKTYYNEDDYYLDDYYFLTMTDKHYDSTVTFLETDDGEFGFAFTVALAKLHRLIQLNTYFVQDKIDDWLEEDFDWD